MFIKFCEDYTWFKPKSASELFYFFWEFWLLSKEHFYIYGWPMGVSDSYYLWEIY
jgi:hypothetical protein